MTWPASQAYGRIAPTPQGIVILPLIFAFGVGTGGAATPEFLKLRSDRGYAIVRIAGDEVPANASRIQQAHWVAPTPAEHLARIREIFKPAVTDLARVFDVSRQAIYNWQANGPVSSTNAARLADLAEAANLLNASGIALSPYTLRRPISDGKSLFDLVREGASAVTAARALIEIVRTEYDQRSALQKRLAGRQRRSREAWVEAGIPSLNEEG